MIELILAMTFWIALPELAAKGEQAESPPEQSFVNLFHVGRQITANGSEPPHAHSRTLQEVFENALLGQFELDFDPKKLTLPVSARVARSGQSIELPAIGLRFRLDLPFSKTPQSVLLRTVYETDDGTLSYTGVLDNDNTSLVTLVLHPEGVLGNVMHAGMTYIISGTENQGFLLSAIDPSQLPRRSIGKSAAAGTGAQPTALREFAPRKRSKRRGASLADLADKTWNSQDGNVSVLVLYTHDIAQIANGTYASLLANQVIAQFNETLTASGVPANNHLTLAGHEILAMPETANFNLTQTQGRCRVDVLWSMAFETTPFVGLRARQLNAEADLVLVIGSTQPGYSECEGGFGRRGGVAFYRDSNAPFAFSTDTYALGDLTALHEIGHVLGGQHEWLGSGVSPPDLESNRGWYPRQTIDPMSAIDCSQGWMTMMGGYDACGFSVEQPNPSQQPTMRLPRWSNTLFSHMGLPLGDWQRANMSLWLQVVLMPEAAAWVVGGTGTAPTAPTGLQATPLCFGQSYVTWTGSMNATYHQLYKSPSWNLSEQTLLYQGSSTQASIFLGEGTSSVLRAKSCNANGCSAFSSSVLAVGPVGCP